MGVKRLFLVLILLFSSLLIYKLYFVKINNIRNIETKLQLNINHHKNNFSVFEKNSIDVKTDVVYLKINLMGGEIQTAELLKYQNKLNFLKKLKLLYTKNNNNYCIKSGFIAYGKKKLIYEKNIQYTADRIRFELINGNKMLFVPLISKIKDGVYCTKTFILQQGSYKINIEYKIHNYNYKKFSFFLVNYLKQIIYPIKTIINFHRYYIKNGFDNIFISKEHQKYKKFLLNDVINNNTFSFVSYSGWLSVSQKYFSVGWILNKNIQNTIYTATVNDNHTVIVGHHTSTLNVFHKQIRRINTVLWMGPKIQHEMLSFAPYFDFTIDYGWFWFISKPLLFFLHFLYLIFRNWGIAIILITCIIRMLSYPLVKSQYISAMIIQSLQPEINALKKKYKDDKQKSSEKVLELYKKNNVSPFSGLLPTLFQMPIFLSLYYMLINSIELRQSPFLFWIHDLSVKDPYYILPIIMGITIFVMQKMTPSSIQSRLIRNKMIDYLPIVLSFCFLWLPAGLVLYYTVSNIVIIIQQLYIYNKFK
ncbi:membrane protein insertase YidC [Buchnera aphidicola]|uniref:membrane protein insertase YidC n=1 Tax=Buchnera aphidicola TaxID=9 RepID=UPI003464425D